MTSWDLVEVTEQRTVVVDGPGQQRTALVTTAPVYRLQLGEPGLQGATGPTGPTGQQGPVGPQGVGVLVQVEFSFALPAITWLATHSLPISKPEVLCLDSSGEEILGDITYPTPTSVRVDWAFPLAGTLVLYG